MNKEAYVILEIQYEGNRPLIWVVGFGGVAQIFSAPELDRELASFHQSRPNSVFKAVLV